MRVTKPPIEQPKFHGTDDQLAESLKGKKLLLAVFVEEMPGVGAGIATRLADGMSAYGKAALREVLEQVIGDLREDIKA